MSVDLIVVQIVTVLVSVLSTGGFWAYLQAKYQSKSSTDELIRGIAHGLIIEKGQKYIDRGWISPEEYDDYYHYLVNPYQRIGGNGGAQRIADLVQRLPVRREDETIQRRIRRS